LCSRAQDHDFGGLDEGRSDLSLFQAELADSIRRNYRGDLLAADRQCDLGHDAIHLDVNDAADQLITRADSSKLGAALRQGHPLFSKVEVLVQFAFRNPVMPALSLDRPDCSRVDPSLERRVTDAENLGSVAKLHQLDTVTQGSVPPAGEARRVASIIDGLRLQRERRGWPNKNQKHERPGKLSRSRACSCVARVPKADYP
jgi:hypothetical protein